MKSILTILFTALTLSLFARADEFTHYDLAGTSPYLLHRSCSISLQIDEKKNQANAVVYVGGASYYLGFGGTVSNDRVRFSTQVMRDFGAQYNYRTFIGAAILTYTREVELVVKLQDGRPTEFSLARSSAFGSALGTPWVCQNLQ